MTIIPLEVQAEVSVDGAYEMHVAQDDVYNMGLDVGVVVNKSIAEYVAGNGIIIEEKVISIDPALIIDCGTSTTVLHGGE